jgi:CDP-diacylglycerol--glycerol-3-phosphate 3-phosphatidyltransferase
MNIPNILTMLRFVMTLGFLYLFWINILASAILFVLAAVTDFFDGYLARKYQLITSFGKIMDPIADKFLILSGFGVFAFIRMVPWWVFWIIAIREIGVTLFRFWAMAKGKVLAAEKAGKIKTTVQIIALCLLFLFQISMQYCLGSLYQIPVTVFFMIGAIAFLWLSVMITLLSGILVIWNNRRLFQG